MVKRFDSLDRDIDLHCSHLLEASAGTGKTFAIENLFIRFLLEGKEGKEPARVDQILVLTFTRAATEELKVRIRENISKVLRNLSICSRNGYIKELEASIPDYLLAILEKGEEEVKLAKKYLETALFCFEEAQIFTIHSFCYRTLMDKGILGEEKSREEFDPMALTRIFGFIKDFFRTGLSPRLYSPGQIQIVLKRYKNDVDELIRALSFLVMKEVKIEKRLNFSESLEIFKKKLKEISKRFNCSPQLIIEDFYRLAPLYRGLCGRGKKVKEEYVREIEFFLDLFFKEDCSDKEYDFLITHGLSSVKKMCCSNLLKSSRPIQRESLKCSNFFSVVQEEVLPILESASSFLEIFSRMGRDASRLLKRVFHEKGVFTHDDLLKEMCKAVEENLFVLEIRNKYRASIIDEFQDTDSFQWHIFRRLFMPKDLSWSPLYLVGDPKQSIYGFRRADVYTYLKAFHAMGEEKRLTLDTNYRSQPSLIQALNSLFSKKNCPGLMLLPKTGEEVEYIEVKSSERVKKRVFSDDRGAIHFFIARGNLGLGKKWPKDSIFEEQFFPFIVEEIQRLHRKESMNFGEFAVLVRDRYEAKNLQEFFNKWRIPSVTRRSASLVNSSAFSCLKELVQAVVNPSSHSDVAIALGGEIFFWTHHQLRAFHEGERVEEVLTWFYLLREKLFSLGFSHFFHDLLHSTWKKDRETILAKILSRKGGEEFYLELQQLAELFIEFYKNRHFSIDSFMSYFDILKDMDMNDDERVKLRQKGEEEAVNILTIHLSKGLEFSVVFALGLAKRGSLKDELIPYRLNNEDLLVVCHRDSEPYREYSREVDAEKSRQLYVAMTRAKYRLYVPVAIEMSRKEVPFSCASPGEIFLSCLGQDFVGEKELYDRIRNFDGESLKRFIESLPKEVKITFSELFENKFDLCVEDEVLKIKSLQNPESFDIPSTPFFIHSFSSLVGGKKGGEILQDPPKDWLEENKTKHTLPAGVETGVFLHSIFEKVPFSKLSGISKGKDLISLIDPMLYRIEMHGWEDVVADIVFNTLRTPLLEGENSFCLKDVDVEKMFVEMEFLYPVEKDILEKKKAFNGFMKGFIDLVFQHGGLYYLLDWKSNWLGSKDLCYGQRELKKAMKEHDYFFQAEVYLSALRRYVTLVDSRPFEECFGGVFYLFLRGLDVEKGPSYGVYREFLL